MLLLAYLATLACFGVVFGIIAGLSELTRTSHPGEALDRLRPAISLLMPLACGGVILWLSRVLAPGSFGDPSAHGAALKSGGVPAILQALLAGLLIGASVHLLTMLTRPHFAHSQLDGFNRMAFRPGFPSTTWALSAILLAPPAEELLFRGFLYGGYRRSFGAVWAAVLTTVIFVAVHVPEMAHHAPSLAGAAGVALAALWWRLRSSAIGPAIAVHAGSNAMITLTFLASR